MIVKSFGKNDGANVNEVVLQNSNNSVSIISYGAITRDWRVLHDSKEVSVLLGFDSLGAYKSDKNFIGIIAGRVANRIERGRFTISGTEYQLGLNDYPNHLHGGYLGFGKQNWDVDIDSSQCSVRLTRVSPHLEEGYPGEVNVTVTISLVGNSLTYEMFAKPDRATPINLAQHNYYNLMGESDIWSHRFQTIARRYTPVDKYLIPTGEIRGLKEISDGFNCIVNHKQQVTIEELDPNKKGIDINLVIDQTKRIEKSVAKIFAENGLSLEIFTDELGVQFYTGANLVSDKRGHSGEKYKPFDGFCLEPQNFPSCPTIKAFPNTIYTPDNPYKQKTTIKICSNGEI